MCNCTIQTNKKIAYKLDAKNAVAVAREVEILKQVRHVRIEIISIIKYSLSSRYTPRTPSPWRERWRS